MLAYVIVVIKFMAQTFILNVSPLTTVCWPGVWLFTDNSRAVFSTYGLWPLWGGEQLCHRGRLRPSENTDIHTTIHSSSKNSYEVTMKVRLWLGVTTASGSEEPEEGSEPALGSQGYCCLLPSLCVSYGSLPLPTRQAKALLPQSSSAQTWALTAVLLPGTAGFLRLSLK